MPLTSRANDMNDTQMLMSQFQPKLDQVREGLQDLDSRVRQTVREHPLLTVFGALIGGYFFGRLVARR